MKKNHYSLGALAALLAVAVASVFAYAGSWNRLSHDGKITAQLNTSVNPWKMAVNHGEPLFGASPESGLIRIPAMRPEAPTSIGGLKGDLYGVVTSFETIGFTTDAFYGKLDLSSGSVSRIFNGERSQFNWGGDGTTTYFKGGAVRQGWLYMPYFCEDMIDPDNVTMQWTRTNLATGECEVAFNYNFKSQPEALVYCMAYSPDEDCFYAINVSIASSFEPGSLLRVDAKTGDFKVVGPIGTTGGIISGICYNTLENKLYGLRANTDGIGEIVSISTKDAKVTVEGETDEYAIPFYVNVRGPMSQPITYSARDNAFVAVVLEPEEGKSVAYKIDAETYEPEYLCTFTNPSLAYVSVLYCSDPIAPATAPAAPVINSIEFDKTSVNGKLKVTMPTELYDATPLTSSQSLTMKVTVDGTEVEKRTGCAPGANLEVSLNNCSNGLHTLNVVVYLNEAELSPVAEQDFFVGNDNPKAPANVKMDANGHITWDAVGALGEHNGYVDTKVVTYDVYINDEKINSAPVANCSFDYTVPGGLNRYTPSVVATANGMASKPGVGAGVVAGNPLNLPQSFTPTAEDASVFIIVNADGNKYGWQYDEVRKEFCILAEEWGITVNNDDWLFLPMINFADNSLMYDFSYNVVNRNNMNDEGIIETYIGKEPTPEAMKTKLMTEREFATTDSKGWKKTTRATTFPLPEGAGVYYIGLRYSSKVASIGIGLDKINVSVSERSSSAPDVAQNVTVKPGDKGALSATVSFTMPLTTAIGDALDKNKKISMIIDTEADSKTVEGLPGSKQSVEITCVQGVNKFTLVSSNEKGKGLDLVVEKYIGYDVPAPINTTWSETSEDNSTITLHWEVPTEGVNGGYVDTENMVYEIYSHYSINFTKIGETTDTQFSYNPLLGTMSNVTVGPVAYTNGERSKYGLFVQDLLGPAHKAPIYETFESVGNSFEYGPWGYASDDSSCYWEWVKDLSPWKIPAPNDCALICVSENPTIGTLNMPKINTTGYDNLNVTLRMYKQSNMLPVEIYAKRFGHEELVKIHTVDLSKLETNKWNDYTFALPAEYCNSPWIRLFLNARVSRDIVFAVDDILVTSSDEYDARIKSFTGTEQSPAGEKGVFSATVENIGMRSIDGQVRFSIIVDGKTVEQQLSKNLSMLPRRTATADAEFASDPAYIGRDVQIKAEFVSAQDANPNNNADTRTWVVSKTNEPLVTDLQGTWNDEHNQVSLTWSNPDLSYGGTEGFESYPEWSCGDEIGVWTNIDADGQKPFAIQQLADKWPGYDEPKGWQVVNAETLGVMKDERLCPHTGKQYLIAFSCSYDESAGEEPIQAEDWLISPEIVGGSKIGFWMGTISGEYKETIELWYSTTDNDPKSFKKARNFSKDGDDSWEYCEYTLPNTAKYFALIYRSWGMWGAMLDDITYTPRQAINWTLDGFNVYRDDELIAENVQGNSYVDTEVGDNNAVYYVTTKASLSDISKECAPGNRVYMWSTSVGDITTLQGIFGVKGAIKIVGHAGEVLKVYNTAGACVAQRLVTSSDATMPVAAGLYVVRIGNRQAKVLVK